MTLPLKAVHQYIEQDPPRLHPAQHQEVPTIVPSSHELTPAILHEVFEVCANPVVTGGHNNLVLAVDENPDAIALIEAAL